MKTELKCEIEKFTHSNIDKTLKQTSADKTEKFDGQNLLGIIFGKKPFFLFMCFFWKI